MQPDDVPSQRYQSGCGVSPLRLGERIPRRSKAYQNPTFRQYLLLGVVIQLYYNFRRDCITPAHETSKAMYASAERPFYDTAMVCLNGHVVNGSSQKYPQHNQRFCDKCGEQSISMCPSCQTPIQGEYYVPGVASLGMSAAPGFCKECGKPFPWTERKLAAAKEVADEFEELSPQDREKLKESLEDLVREGPKTEPAKLKFKNVMRKGGSGSLEIMKGIVTELVSETVRRSIYGP
jgi:hypothetical protein